MVGRGYVKKDEEKRRANLIRQMQALSRARVNDGVKLAYLSQEQMDLIDELDLTALTEFKRSSGGVVEVKFMDRFKMLEQLLALTEEQGADPMEAVLQVLGGGEADGA